MSLRLTKFPWAAGSFAVLLVSFGFPVSGQTNQTTGHAVVEGKVRDDQKQPLNASVSLERESGERTLTTTADSQGRFRFESLPAGSYILRAKLAGYQESAEGPFVLREHETKSFEVLQKKMQSVTAPNDASGISFSDEPSFTVAGVTDTTALGGHGSGPIVRNSNDLSKETASLAREGEASPSAAKLDASARETALRAALARQDDADEHAQLAEIEEAEGRPVDAVHDYERAAQLQPSEPHLFAWGAELLLHHAPEPAIEVFAKGHRLYPQSSRMMLGLGAAWYALRSDEQAQQLFLQASDVNPADPTPYLFLGRLQRTEQRLPPQWVEKMKRFVELHPKNAMAHYLYGAALMKRSETPSKAVATAEAELKTAIKLDARLGDAYLQLGILYMDRNDLPAAAVALQNAVENAPASIDAHYRLAQVYRRMGEAEKASKEVAEYKRLTERTDQDAERERHEIPQFVYTLRSQTPTAAPGSPKPN